MVVVLDFAVGVLGAKTAAGCSEIAYSVIGKSYEVVDSA